MPSSTPSAVAPSSSSSARSWMRWRSAGLATAFTSSGVTKGRPRQPRPRLRRVQQHRRAAGRHAERERRRLAGRPRQGDDVREHGGVDADRRRSRRGQRPGRRRRRPGGRPLHARREDRARRRGGRAPPAPARRSGSRPASLNRKRSSWASGSGYVPSYSTGFWVATTMNGSGSGCVRALDRDLALLHRLEQGGLGLRRRAVDLVGEQQVREDAGPRGTGTSPVGGLSRWSGRCTSDGIRSGVNCTRLKSRSSAAATAFTSSVLATPGTPSSSTWPSDEQRGDEARQRAVLTDDDLRRPRRAPRAPRSRGFASPPSAPVTGGIMPAIRGRPCGPPRHRVLRSRVRRGWWGAVPRGLAPPHRAPRRCARRRGRRRRQVAWSPAGRGGP